MSFVTRLGLGISITVLAACGASPPPFEDVPPPAEDAPAAPEPATSPSADPAGEPTAQPTAQTGPESSCEGVQACQKQGAEALRGGDRPLAMKLYGLACEAGGVKGCYMLGDLHASGGKPDLTAARAAFASGCGGGISYNDACARLAALAAAGQGGSRDAALAAKSAKIGCSVLGSDDDNRASRALACQVLGEAARDGKGTEKDEDRARRAFEDGCKLGHQPACEERDRIAAEQDKGKLPGANINIGSMTVDGVTVSDLSCKMAGGGLGGLFGSLTLAAALGKRKTQLDACSRGKQVQTTVHWKQSASRITSVTAKSDDAKRNSCVERALRGAPAAQAAECLGTVTHGK